MEDKNKEGFIKIQEATTKFKKPEITIRRWIKKLEKTDYAEFEKCVVKERTKTGYFYLIFENCLIKKYGLPNQLPNQKDKVITQKPKVISQNHDQKPEVPNQNKKVISQNDKVIRQEGILIKENKGLQHYLENVKIENVGLKKENEFKNETILKQDESEKREREERKREVDYFKERLNKKDEVVPHLVAIVQNLQSELRQLQLEAPKKKKHFWQR